MSKLLRVLAIVAAISVALTAATRIVGHADPPQASFSHESYDAGERLPGDKVDHSFQVTNTGESPLIVSRIKASCGCAKASISCSRLEAGQTAEIHVELNVQPGAYVTAAKTYVWTNDPQSPLMELSLVARNSPHFELSPPTIDFGNIPHDRSSPSELRFRVLAQNPETLEVAVADFVSPTPVSAKLHNDPVKGSWLYIALSEDAPVGPLTATITIRRRDDSFVTAFSRKVYDVRGNVSGRVSAQPSISIIRADPEAGPTVSLVELVQNKGAVGDADWKVIDTTGNVSPYLNARVVVKDSRTFVELSVSPAIKDDSVRSFAGAVNVALSSVDGLSVRIPVKVFVLTKVTKEKKK